jgi:hypothetical protein
MRRGIRQVAKGYIQKSNFDESIVKAEMRGGTRPEVEPCGWIPRANPPSFRLPRGANRVESLYPSDVTLDSSLLRLNK